MATDLVSLNRVRYSGLDFDTISDDLRAQLQIKFAASFNDFSVSSLGIVLLDVVAFGLDTLSFYLDRRATDTYLATARSKRSVALLSRQLGYKMGGAVASTTTLSVATKTSLAFPVPIPAGFQFEGPNGEIYETAQAVTIPAASTAAVSIPTYQGETVTENFISDGTPNQTFNLTKVPTDAAIAQGTVQVTVNGSDFIESDFISFDETDQFEINYTADPPSLRFGDGVAGNIPAKNASIVVTYVATLGAAGQLLSHTITNVANPLVVMSQAIDLSIDNPSNTVGGADPETLDHAKTYAPRVFKSRRVAVTQQDYEALAGSYADPLFGRVAVAQAVSARSAASDLDLQNFLSDINSTVGDVAAAIQSALTAFEFNNATDRANGVVAKPAGKSLASSDVGKTAVQTDDYTHWVLTSFGPPLVWEQINNTSQTRGAFVLTDELATYAATLQTTLTSLLTQLTTINTNFTSILGSARSANNASSQQQQDFTDASGDVTSGRASLTSATNLVNGISTAGSSQLTSSDKTSLLTYISNADTYFSQVNSLLTTINNLASTIAAACSSIISLTQNNQAILIGPAATTIGITTAAPVGSAQPSLAYTLSTNIGNILTNLGSATSPYTALYEDLHSILDQQSFGQSTIAADTTGIYDHVDSILSADCKANLVVVPILARDAAGFYAAPSIGLIKSLQTLLDSVKEVTQTVIVTSGANALVPAAIKARLSITTGTSDQITKASATTIIDGVLRDRAFGKSLYVSDLVNPLRDISGVVFVNVSILGYRPDGSLTILTDKLDSDGNLIIAAGEVVTLSESDLTINIEIFSNS